MQNYPINLNAGSTVLSGMSIEELKAELSSTLQITAHHLVHLADVWRELERRGEDLSGLRSGLWRYMPLIANGTLRAELVVRYAGNTTLLRRLARLSDVEQNRLVKKGMINLVTMGRDGYQESEVPLEQLSSNEINLVISDRLIDPKEQRSRLGSMPRTPVDSPPRIAQRIALAASRRRQGGEERVHTIGIPLTSAEWESLTENAKTIGLSVTSVVAGALAYCGLFQPLSASENANKSSNNHRQGVSAPSDGNPVKQ